MDLDFHLSSEEYNNCKIAGPISSHVCQLTIMNFEMAPVYESRMYFESVICHLSFIWGDRSQSATMSQMWILWAFSFSLLWFKWVWYASVVWLVKQLLIWLIKQLMIFFKLDTDTNARSREYTDFREWCIEKYVEITCNLLRARIKYMHKHGLRMAAKNK